MCLVFTLNPFLLSNYISVPVYAIRIYLSVFGLGPLEYLGLIFVEFGGESVCGLVQSGDFVEVVLQLGRKVAADRHELLLPSRVKSPFIIPSTHGRRWKNTINSISIILAIVRSDTGI